MLCPSASALCTWIPEWGCHPHPHYPNQCFISKVICPSYILHLLVTGKKERTNPEDRDSNPEPSLAPLKLNPLPISLQSGYLLLSHFLASKNFQLWLQTASFERVEGTVLTWVGIRNEDSQEWRCYISWVTILITKFIYKGRYHHWLCFWKKVIATPALCIRYNAISMYQVFSEPA